MDLRQKLVADFVGHTANYDLMTVDIVWSGEYGQNKYTKPLDEKVEFFKMKGRVFDIIYAQQFDRQFLDLLCDLAEKIRMLAKTKMGARKLSGLLQHKRAMLYFVQPCTRTFLSFQNACHLLGLNVSESRGTSTSSEVKGESPEDTIRTFASYVDLIISRHHEAGIAEKTAWVLNQTERTVPVRCWRSR